VIWKSFWGVHIRKAGGITRPLQISSAVLIAPFSGFLIFPVAALLPGSKEVITYTLLRDAGGIGQSERCAVFIIAPVIAYAQVLLQVQLLPYNQLACSGVRLRQPRWLWMIQAMALLWHGKWMTTRS
jgi:hypothetical protein